MANRQVGVRLSCRKVSLTRSCKKRQFVGVVFLGCLQGSSGTALPRVWGVSPSRDATPGVMGPGGLWKDASGTSLGCVWDASGVRLACVWGDVFETSLDLKSVRIFFSVLRVRGLRTHAPCCATHIQLCVARVSPRPQLPRLQCDPAAAICPGEGWGGGRSSSRLQCHSVVLRPEIWLGRRGGLEGV